MNHFVGPNPHLAQGDPVGSLTDSKAQGEATDRQKYRALCAHASGIPIFSQAWWLDAAVGPQNWNAILVEEGDRIAAAMPYVASRIFGFRVIRQPKLTMTAGPWFAPMAGSPATIMSRQMRLMENLIDQLPPFDHFNQNWHYSIKNWLPFRWRGFVQTTNYTYVYPDLRDLDAIWKNIHSNIRTDIKKAESRFKLEVRDDLPMDTFMALNRQVFERQTVRRGFSDSDVLLLDAACRQQGACKHFIAVDPQGQPHAGVYLIWDDQSAYYLLGGADPALRNSGAASLCLWHAIRFSATVTRSFDFEGSVLQPIERHFRAFGAEQKPYMAVSKTPSHLLAAYFFLRSRLAEG